MHRNKPVKGSKLIPKASLIMGKEYNIHTNDRNYVMTSDST